MGAERRLARHPSHCGATPPVTCCVLLAWIGCGGGAVPQAVAAHWMGVELCPHCLGGWRRSGTSRGSARSGSRRGLRRRRVGRRSRVRRWQRLRRQRSASGLRRVVRDLGGPWWAHIACPVRGSGQAADASAGRVAGRMQWVAEGSRTVLHIERLQWSLGRLDRRACASVDASTIALLAKKSCRRARVGSCRASYSQLRRHEELAVELIGGDVAGDELVRRRRTEEGRPERSPAHLLAPWG